MIGRDQIGLRDADGRLAAALALRICGHARRDRQPVVPANLHDLRITDRDPAHVINRHGLLVVGQTVSGTAPEHAHRAIQAHHHRWQRFVAQRHHHPEPRPRQPRAEQHRRPPGDLRPVAVVPLHPQPRLRDPRPRPPPVLATPPPLGLRDPPARRPLRPQVADRDQLPVRGISPDLPVRAVDQLIDLLGEQRLHRRPGALHDRHPARPLTLPDPVRDRLVITSDQARRRAERARQVIRLQNLHHSLRLHHVPVSRSRLDSQTRGVTGRSGQNRWGESWPPVGRISGRPWGFPVAAYGENLMATHKPPKGRRDRGVAIAMARPKRA